MAEGQQGPYSHGQQWLAVILSSVLGWCGVTVMLFGVSDWRLLVAIAPLTALIGLPIVIVFVWIIGGSILNRVLHAPVTWTQSAVGGASVALALIVLLLMITLILLLLRTFQPETALATGVGGQPGNALGIFDRSGLIVVTRQILLFAGFGAAIGLFVRAIIGPGRTP